MQIKSPGACARNVKWSEIRSAEANQSMLTLKRVSKYRPGGAWNADDYDVFGGLAADALS